MGAIDEKILVPFLDFIHVHFSNYMITIIYSTKFNVIFNRILKTL